MVERANIHLSLRRQCELLGICRGNLYYVPRPSGGDELAVMDRIDREFTEHPFTGVERMSHVLHREHGLLVNHKRVRRLMRRMGLMAIYPKPRTSVPAAVYTKYPCLLHTMEIDAPDLAWCSDITYIRLRGGFMYLVAVMDYFSRYVLSWSISNSLDSSFCVECLEDALKISQPRIFHSDQGKQYGSGCFVEVLQGRAISISMSGRGRAFDNIMVERLWRTVKYEEVYLNEYADGHALSSGIDVYFGYYNHRRPHQSLNWQTPAEVYYANRAADSLRCARLMAPLRESAGTTNGPNNFHLIEGQNWS
jgi:putative transposase